MLEKIINSARRFVGVSLLTGALAFGPFLGGCGDDHKHHNVNRPPVVQSIPDQTVQEGEQFILDLEDYISDPDGDILTVEFDNGPGSIVNNQFDYQDKIDNNHDDDIYPIEFIVKDAHGGETRGSFMLTQLDINHNPVIQVIADQIVQEGEQFILDLGNYGSDPDGDILTIELDDNVPGSIDKNKFSYTDPIDNNHDDDIYKIGFVVKDGYGGQTRGSFKLRQLDINHNPVIQVIADQIVQEGEQFIFDFGNDISDKDGDTLVVKQISGPPEINNNQFQHQDQRDDDKDNNEYIIGFKVTDGYGGEAIGSFKLTQQDTYYRLPVKFFDDKINWIAYAPTNFNPEVHQFPSEGSIRSDLEVLAKANFKGIVTYGSDSTLGSIPRIAKEVGFKYVIMGVWDFNNLEEWDNSIKAKGDVDGYCLGNEGISAGRYTLNVLKDKMNELRLETDKPVTTTEPIGEYDNDLLEAGGWIFPNTHPFHQGKKDPNLAAEWTVGQYDDLTDQKNLLGLADKIVVFKEVGLPSGGEGGLSEANQNKYYRTLEYLTSNDSKTVFVYFEAFDQPWKDWAQAEPYWGLFKQDRSEKEVSKPQIILTDVPPKGSFDNLKGRTVNIKPLDHRVSVYIQVDGVWWMKPYWDNPLTKILKNSSWVTDITTGGNDQDATKIYSAIVTPDYVPVKNSLPNINDGKVIAETSVTR